MIDPGPIPDFLRHETPGPDAWRLFFATRPRPWLQEPKVKRIPTEESVMAETSRFVDDDGRPVKGNGPGRWSPPLNELRTVREQLIAEGKLPPEEKLPDMTDPLPEEKGSASKASRGVVTEKAKKDAKTDGRSINELLAEAKRRGYVEQPAPNGGVRAMRVRNFLRNYKGPAK